MTEKYHENDPMIDVISDDYRMLQMMSRFGITLGFGEQTVGAACKTANVDVQTFLTIVNYLKDASHAHINEMVERISLPSLLRYLKNSHAYFVDYRLPYIRRKLINAIDCSGRNQIASLILKFYDEYAAEVQAHMEYENEVVHPYVENLLQNRLPQSSYAETVGEHEGNHASIEKSISELKSVIIKYYPNDNNAQLLNDVLMDIYMVEEDLLTHCHLEDTLFAECVHRLEREVKSRANELYFEREEAEPVGNATEELSEREREVIRLVAMGFQNKEIAEKMFLSVNTVMTHRRNIVRKLNIHSAASIAIYAIVHGIISVEEVNL